MTVQKTRTKSGALRYRALVKSGSAQITGAHGWTPDKRTAQADERTLLDQRDAGRLAAAAGQTLGTYLDAYVGQLVEHASTGKPLAPTTAGKYRDQARRISAVIGDVRLTALREQHVEDLRRELLDVRRLAAPTVRDTLAFLGRALGKAERRGLLRVANPASAQAVFRPAGKAQPAPVIHADTAHRILATVVGHQHLDAAVHLGLLCGLRREEILGLRWSAVDLDARTIEMRPGDVLTLADGELHFGDPKTDAGTRTVPVAPQAVEALRRHRALQTERRIGSSGTWQRDLVIEIDGEPFRPDSFSRSWRQFAARHDLAGITFHDLRHGGAQILVEIGMPVEHALRIGGWSGREILAAYAPVLSPEQLATYAAAMGAHVENGGAR